MNIARWAAFVFLFAACATAAMAGGESASVANLRLQWADPGTIHLDSFPAASNGVRLPGPYSPRPAISEPRLQIFDRSMTIQQLADGRVHYRINIPNALGAGIGGQVNTNSAKLTLTWPRKN